MTEETPSRDDEPSSNWLAPQPELPPVAPSSPPQPPFSLYALLALIAGLSTPVLSLVVSVILLFVPAESEETTPLLISIVMAVGLIGLPLAWYAFLRLRGQTRLWRTNNWWVVGASAAIVGLLLAGQAFASLQVFPEVMLGIIQPLIFGAASAALIALVAGKWQGISKLRVWASLASGAWLSVGLSLVAEIVLVGGLAVIGIFILMALAPDDANRILALARNLDNFNPEALLEFAFRPWVIGGVFVVAAILIPLLEELLKPLSVILILGKRPSAMAAFLGGVMGGIGFAYSESLSNLMTINDPWFVLVVARLGTFVMHGFTAGLVGWGWGQLAARRPLRLLAAYSGAVAIHGLWNGLVVILVFSSLYVAENAAPASPLTALLNLLAGGGVLVLIFLVPACAAGLAVIGYHLRSRA